MRPIVRANFRVFQRDQYFGCQFLRSRWFKYNVFAQSWQHVCSFPRGMRQKRGTGYTGNYEVISLRTCAAIRGRINFMHRKPGASRRIGNWPQGIQHVLEKEAERTNTKALSATDLIFMRKTHLRSSVKCLKLRNYNINQVPRWDAKIAHDKNLKRRKSRSHYLQLAKY